jgi:hypothetical protein
MINLRADGELSGEYDSGSTVGKHKYHNTSRADRHSCEFADAEPWEGTKADQAGEQVFYVEVPSLATLNIGQSYNNYDSVHELRWGGPCPGATSLGCIDDNFGATTHGIAVADENNGEYTRMNWTNTEGSSQKAYFIVDGYYQSEGTFTIDWNLTTAPVANTTAAPVATTMPPHGTDKTFEPVTWTNLATNTALLGSNGGLEKTATDENWNGGASSTNRIYAQVGLEQVLKFKCVPDTYGLIGLSTVHANPINWNLVDSHQYQHINHGIVCHQNNNFGFAESNKFLHNKGSYTADTVFDIKVNGDAVTYWKDGEQIFTSADTAVFPLEVDAALVYKGASEVSVLAFPV